MAPAPITKANLDKAGQHIPKNTPILNINFMRFKEVATYENHPEFNEPQLSGKDAFMQRYAPALNAIAEEMGFAADIKPGFRGAPVVGILPDGDEKWDIITTVTFPSFEAFRKVVESKEYMERADPHRVATVEEQKLMCTVEI